MNLIDRNIRYVPVAHRRVTFAEQVRRAVLEWRPDVIALELPETLRPWIEDGVRRLPLVTAVCYEEAGLPGVMAYLPVDPCDALIEAVRIGLETGLPLACIDLDLPALQDHHQYVPDDLIIDKTGLERYVERLAPLLRATDDNPRRVARERWMAQRLLELAADGRRVLCVLGLAHYLNVRGMVQAGGPAGELPQVETVQERPGAQLAAVAPESLTQVLGEMPCLTWFYEQTRAQLDVTGEVAFDKLGAIVEILNRARDAYGKHYRETISMTHWRALLQFTRNLAMTAGRLRPDLYELVLGARGTVDGDFGWEVYELASSYPPQQDRPDTLPQLRIKGVRGRLEGREERFRMQPRWEEPPTEAARLGLRRRPPMHLRAFWREQWQKGFDGRGICSWPPEDLVQERFMTYVRKRALQRLTEDRRQVQEFSTSMLDGLDVRETMRNWHNGKIYVHQTPQPQGRVGSVVLVFEDEPFDMLGSWRSTLYAENRNESDISFFATPLGENVVGPRICRTEFGGILSVWPAWGIPDIWSFDLSEQIRSAGDALLAAGILFSADRYVVWVADRPPRGVLRQLAAVNRKHILHLPLTTFSRRHLHKIRNFHILDGRDVRAWARDYIVED